MAAHKKFTEDEKINMRLRREAGETLESIADDYDCAIRTVSYHTDERYREQHKANQRKQTARRKCRKS